MKSTVRKRRIYFIQLIYNEKTLQYLIESYTLDGAVGIIREYFNISPKNILQKRLATRQDILNIPDKRVMVCSHMMIPLECRTDYISKLK